MDGSLVLIAMGVSVVAGYSLEKLGFERFIKPEAYGAPAAAGCGGGRAGASAPVNKWKAIWQVTWVDFKKVLPYLMGGIALGSMIYGFMPTEFVSAMASKDNPLAVPIAAIIGIPLYIRAEAVIPLSAALAAKGTPTQFANNTEVTDGFYL